MGKCGNRLLTYVNIMKLELLFHKSDAGSKQK